MGKAFVSELADYPVSVLRKSAEDMRDTMFAYPAFRGEEPDSEENKDTYYDYCEYHCPLYRIFFC